jgi:hypothetical protein
MASFSSVDCCEEAGTAREDYEDFRGILSASVQLRCAWADRHSLATDVVGGRREWPKGSAGAVPKAYSAAIEPVTSPGSPAASGQEIGYAEALVTIRYSTIVTDLVTESIEPFAEFITLDHRFFRWGAGDGPWLREEEAPGRLVRGINYVRNELELMSTPADNVYDLIGYVNNAPLAAPILGRTFATETLLYAPPIVNAKKDSTGAYRFDITKKFTWQPQGWNKYFRPLTGTWVAIHLAGSGTPYKSYPLGDLSALI